MSDILELFQRCVELHQKGEFAIAAQGYAAILRADPNHADAWHLSGVLAHQSGRSASAMEYIQRAIELNPCGSEYYANLAAIQMAHGLWTLAVATAEQAVTVSPDSAPAWYQKGRAHAKLGQTEMALSALRSAQQHEFDPALVWQEIGSVLQVAGEFSKSVEALEASLQHQPLQPSVWLTLSRWVTTRQYQFSASQLQQMYQVLQQHPHDKEKSRVAFSLAAHFDSQGDFNQAFEFLKRGNGYSRSYLHSKGSRYDSARRTQRVDDLIGIFTPEFVRNLGPVSESRRPIVVVGMPRSGTSLIEQILGRHPQVAAGGELSYWTTLFEQTFDWTELADKLGSITTAWRKSAAEGYDAVLRTIAPTAERVIDKLPGNYLYLGLIATAFPHAIIIHCCRDPRDTCLSCFAQLFDDEQLQLATSEFGALADRYKDYARLMKHWHTVFPGRIIDVYYEQLVHDPEAEVRRLLQRCGLAWSDNCLQAHHSRGTVRTASVVQVRQPLYQTSRGRWARYESHLQPLCELISECIAAYEIREGA